MTQAVLCEVAEAAWEKTHMNLAYSPNKNILWFVVGFLQLNLSEREKKPPLLGEEISPFRQCPTAPLLNDSQHPRPSASFSLYTSGQVRRHGEEVCQPLFLPLFSGSAPVEVLLWRFNERGEPWQCWGPSNPP